MPSVECIVGDGLREQFTPARHAERHRTGLFFGGAHAVREPAAKRTVTCVDGQHLVDPARTVLRARSERGG